MIKAVIFDMDGVMIDSEPLWEKTEKIMMARKGLEYTPVYREKIVGLGQKDSARLLKNTFALDATIEQIIGERISILLDIYNSELLLREGLINLLNLLMGNRYKLSLASSSPIKVIKFVLDKFGLNHYFDPVISGDFVERGKPDPAIYLHTARRLGVSVEECIVIEDSINGVISAKDAGMFCIAVPDKRLDPGGFIRADAILDNVAEINMATLNRFN